MPRILSLVVLLAILTCTNATAQNSSVVILPPVTVTASRIPGVGETLYGTNVITRAQIEAVKPTSVVDLLRLVPGLHLDQPGDRGGTSSLYLRGADPNFTVVMIDGVRVNDPTNSRGGSFNFNLLDPGSIERIEVVKGPASALYGSDALAGVVNIITREGGAKPSASAQGEVGGFGYRRAWAEVSGPIGKGSFALGGAYVDAGTPIDGSSLIGRTLNGKVRIPVTEHTTLHLNSFYSTDDATTYPDDSGGPTFAAIRDVDRRDTRLLTGGATINHDFGNNNSVSAHVSHYKSTETLNSPGVAPGLRDPAGIPPNWSSSNFNRDTASANFVLSPFSALQVSGGAEIISEHGSSDSKLIFGPLVIPGHFDLKRKIRAPFGEVRLTLPFGLTVNAGTRVDYPDKFDSKISSRVAIRQAFEATGTAIFARWGEGFKLPSFFALANPIVGNPDLVPETSKSVEAGIEQKFLDGAGHLRLTAFHNRYFNLIDFEEGPPPRLVNRSQVVTRGIETGGDIQMLPNLTVGGHVTYLESEIVGTPEPLRNRPKWRGGMNVLYEPRDDLSVSLNANYVGTVPDSSIPTGDRMLDAYLRVDLAVNVKLAEHFSVTLAVDNLFNTYYEEAVGFPGIGIRPRLIARAVF